MNCLNSRNRNINKSGSNLQFVTRAPLINGAPGNFCFAVKRIITQATITVAVVSQEVHFAPCTNTHRRAAMCRCQSKLSPQIVKASMVQRSVQPAAQQQQQQQPSLNFLFSIVHTSRPSRCFRSAVDELSPYGSIPLRSAPFGRCRSESGVNLYVSANAMSGHMPKTIQSLSLRPKRNSHDSLSFFSGDDEVDDCTAAANTTMTTTTTTAADDGDIATTSSAKHGTWGM
jgi:hypothetical protein